MGLVSTVKRAVGKVVNKANGTLSWDMSTKEARERQVKRDFEYAKVERAEQTAKMVEMNNYYNNRCYSNTQIAALADKHKWDSVPPSIPYAYIHVESQIDDNIPSFQFKGRDENLDPAKAKIREQVVNFIFYNNRIEELNLDNERALKEIGNAFFKVSFDGGIQVTPYVKGDIVIGNPDPANIFNQPGAYDIDSSEWIIYSFRMHRRAARRTFGAVIDSIYTDNDHGTTEIYDTVHRSIDDDTLQVVEYWYRDDEGDIACSIQVNNVEVRHIPKYWKNTRLSGNKMFPIVKYCDTPVRKSFWDRGEIEAIKDLIDAANREFFTAIMNDMFCSNDIIVREENALVNKASALPGSEWIVKPGKVDAVRRLGGMTSNGGLLGMIQFIQERMEDTNGNYAVRGAEPVRVDTASGFAQLREDRDARFKVKSAGRLQGYTRLVELCDWTALEFYNQDRAIIIRGKKEGEPDIIFNYNSENERIITRYDITTDPETGEEMQIPAEYYYPKIDVEITAGDGIRKSKALTLAATQELSQMPINPTNVGIVMSIIDLLDLPNKKEVKASIESAVQQQMMAAQQQGGGGGPPQQAQAGGSPQEILEILPPEVQQIVSQMSPDDQVAFLSQAPEDIMAFVDQVLGGGQPQ